MRYLLVGLVAGMALSRFILFVAEPLPTMYVDTLTHRCVKVEDAPGHKQHSCDAQPERYNTILVKPEDAP